MTRFLSLRRVFGLTFAGAAGLVVSAAFTTSGVVLLPACEELPKGTCFGERLNAGNDGGPTEECSSCIQQKACCDYVGACDLDEKCKTEVKATQRCVIEAGAGGEARCKGELTLQTSRDMYGCMRNSCGKNCGLPQCTLRPEVALLANPICDRCMGGVCCQQINDCYQNRSCQLALECITTHCPRTLGPAMTLLGATPPDAIQRIRDDVCSGKPPADIGERGGPGACLERCLDDFAPLGASGTNEDIAARCLAFSVYACGAAQKCGTACTQSEAGAYGDSWDEDRLDRDAGARDAAGDAPADSPAE